MTMTICDVIAMWPKQHGVLRSLSPVSAQARKKAEEAAVKKAAWRLSQWTMTVKTYWMMVDDGHKTVIVQISLNSIR
jgi:hypothetical protein